MRPIVFYWLVLAGMVGIVLLWYGSRQKKSAQ